MNDEDELGIPLGVVFFVIALVISLVIGLSVWKLNHAGGVPVVEAAPTPIAEVMEQGHGEGAATTEAAADSAVAFTDVAPVGEPQLKVYFNVGQTDLSDEARTNVTALAKVITQMGEAKAVVLISGFHDETGTAQVNAEVAKQRAFSVRDALIADGVAPETVLLRKPEVTLGGGDAAEARRVEVRVQ